MNKTKVLKFGGSSVATPESIRQVIKIVESCTPPPRAVVVSALGGATDLLKRIAELAAQNEDANEIEKLLESLESRHREAIAELVPPSVQSSVLIKAQLLFKELRERIQGVSLTGEITPRLRDDIMSKGELLSSLIVSAAASSAKLTAHPVDARTLIVTDDSFTKAQPNFQKTKDRVTELLTVSDSIPIVTGFIAATEDGRTTTLGRGGSDYTAAILAEALEVEELEIWSDVDGMMTADPNKVTKAFVQEVVTYDDAMELSHFGAKVIYPPTIQPARQAGIPIVLKNTFNPEAPGTRIQTNKALNHLQNITGITSIRSIALVQVEGSGLVGVSGSAARVFTALHNAGVNVILISQASSEHSICFAITESEEEKARKALERCFQNEIAQGQIDSLTTVSNCSIVSVVGEGMRYAPGTCAQIFKALGENGINVLAIAQGSSERNISFVVDSKWELRALNALHEEILFANRKTNSLYLFGSGGVAETLLEQIYEHQKKRKEDNGHDLKVVAICNSRQMLLDREGIDLETWKSSLKSAEEARTDTFLQWIDEGLSYGATVIDCTASEAIAGLYPEILKRNVPVVTPNKKAQTGSYFVYQTLKALSRPGKAKFLYETSVGAGLPVLSTLKDLRETGDEIISVEAVLSGTLSYLFNTYALNDSFSELVKDANEKGYTEPDPREDLSGLDVGRKLLILAREIGYVLELEDVEIENLIPVSCQGEISLEEFYKLLKKSDSQFQQKLLDAQKNDAKLCYLGSITDGRARVSLQSLSKSHPFYNLSGTDNMICFRTKRYYDRPLVIQGPGAGTEVTAAGVLADVLRVL